MAEIKRQMTTPDTPPQPAEKRRARRWWPYFLFGPPLALLVAAAALIIFLRTDFGLQRIEALANRFLADIGGQSIVLANLHGRFPFDLRLDGLRLADEHGQWLELDDLVLRWSGRDLLAARVRIHELSATRAELLRPPAAGEPQPDPKQREPFQGIDLPRVFPQVAVDRLFLEQIILAEAVTGQRTVLRLDAHLDAGKHGLTADLRLESLEGPAGLLTLRSSFNPADDVLILTAEFSDPGGNLAPVLGLPDATPLRLHLDGDGPPAAWAGSLQANAGELITLDSDLALEWQDHPRLTWSGHFLVSPALLPGPADAYLPRTAFEIAMSMPEPDQVRLERITLDNPAARLQVTADLDPAQGQIHGDLALEVVDTRPLNSLLGVNLGPDIKLAVDFSGPLTGPDVNLSLTLRDIVADPVQVAALGLDATILFHQEDSLIIAAQGSLTSQGLHVPDAGLPDALAASLTADFDLAFMQQDNLLELKSLLLRGQGLEMRSQASLALESMDLAARLSLSPTDLHPWLAPHDLAYAGQAALEITAQGTVQPLDLHMDVQAGLDALDGLPEPLPNMLGKTVDLGAAIQLSAPALDSGASGLGLIQVSGVRILAQALTLEADAAFMPKTRDLTASLRLELPDLSQTAPSPELDLSGAAVLEAQADGLLGHDLSLEASLSSDDLALAGLDAFTLNVLLFAQGLDADPAGTLSLSASPMGAALTARSDFALKDSVLGFTDLLLTLPKGRLAGHCQVDLESGMLTTELQGRITDIAPLARLAGQDMQGALDFTFDVLPDQEALRAGLNANLANFSANFGAVRDLSIQAEALDILEEPTLDVAITLQALQAGETRLDTLAANISGTPRELALSASIQGHALHPLHLDVQAEYAARTPAHVLHISQISGAWAEQPLLLSTPLTVSIAQDDLAVSPLLLEFGRATIRGQAELAKQTADLRLGVENLPLALFTDQLRGTLTAGAVLSGSKSALDGNFTLLGHDISPQHPQFTDVLAVDLHADAVLQTDGLAFTATLQRTENQVPLLHAQGQTALRLSLDPIDLDLPQDTPVQATLAGELDLGWLGEIILPETQLLNGALALDLRLAGTLNDPTPSGRVEILDASYQHVHQGVLLRDITGVASLDKDHLRLESLTATDGDQGVLRVAGQAGLDPEAAFPFSFSIQGTDMNVLNSPLAKARLADVQLDVSGAASAQDVRGHLIFDRVEVFLRDLGGPQVTELHVVEINGPNAGVMQRASQRDAPSPPRITLDMDIRFPARVFVRGRGLDSEWGGNLHVSGKVDQPELRGEIKPIRGRLDMLGTRFTLSNQSIIQFVGSHPPTPYINVLAEQAGKDHTFTLNASGVPPDIELHLSSQPPLPEDEVLAQMLFGRSLSSITPVQAAKLAMAARELAGHGGGMDILGTARDILLLDDLDVVSGREDGEMSLRAGKHVNERVYLRLDSDLGTGEETISADVELTPRINLESTIGPKGGGVGLFWKHDY